MLRCKAMMIKQGHNVAAGFIMHSNTKKHSCKNKVNSKHVLLLFYNWASDIDDSHNQFISDHFIWKTAWQKQKNYKMPFLVGNIMVQLSISLKYQIVSIFNLMYT